MSAHKGREQIIDNLAEHGLVDLKQIHWNCSAAALYEQAIRRREAVLGAGGQLIGHTGKHTGRSPSDKYVVREPETEKRVWWGKVNQPLDEGVFDGLCRQMIDYHRGRELFVQDLHAGADPAFRFPVRVITELAWHSLFARNMFRGPEPGGAPASGSQITVIGTPGFKAPAETPGLRSPVFIALHPGRRLVLIGGTAYAGEIKKSVFTLLNYLYPEMGVFPMHASANIGRDGDTALFFGLSGTGKTTLSADPERSLIGDDEHGWSPNGVFNFEGGCYAKVIRLSALGEPQIHAAIHRFGAILENVVYDEGLRELNLESDEITENTRASYPLSFVPGAVAGGAGGHPRTIVMLTADAFGVLPPIARLTPEQAMYHFLSGYTAKVAGTERGIKEPQATFSACFGEPFLVLNPVAYAKMLGERLERHPTRVWWLNTGWTGGPYGTGRRMALSHTRAMLAAALSGSLDKAAYRFDPLFRVEVPKFCPEVPREVLDPRGTWPDPAAYDAKARELAGRFRENFKRFEGEIDRQLGGALETAGPAA